MKNEKRGSSGFVYFIKPEGRDWVKIGWTTNAKQRLIDLQCGSPEALSLLLVIPGSLALESSILSCLHSSDGRGEWRAYSEELKVLINTLAQFPDRAEEIVALAHAFYAQSIKRRAIIGRDRLRGIGYPVQDAPFPYAYEAADMLIATVLPVSSHGDAA
ncbi:GIY-YIG nuclease family protein [Sphingobium yanoikuyae]|uniref:GIY-YIG nuclease family protein n=1 Tax=Sphingobium yanoikuyae TaxID=13690 RepID=UPI0028DB8BE8|nr:hypothetical protein [Sphingobium yanoikuyae]